ncbi:MAG: undecaprenyldiphospho-muramoylpentapeptide beta-N-acetylglucosaminyltransferase [Deltaproteobacteria bacterium]|nr:undecaprenyldiphospho-muramoylpentapeptide beta-N-acetylglucosaminyltransferase [Deltaproteobacteria bacterium]
MRLLVAGGGTGGHLFPGVAVAERWLAGGSDRAVAFAGTTSGVEARLVPELGHRFFPVRAGAVAGGGLLAKIRSLGRVLLGVHDAGAVLREFDPHVVLGVGGYASVPVMLRSVLARRPTAIQEQNAAPGLANRLLGKLVRRVFVTFESSRSHFPPGRAVLTGNPIRPSVLARLEETRRARATRTAGAVPSILISGGSQGSRFLNENVPAAIAAWLASRRASQPGAAAPRIVHQTGRADEETTRVRYAELGLAASVTAFIRDMGQAYGEADLVVARAGAGTLSELAAVGLPAVLVPYPFAGAHQEANARAHAALGAGVCVTQAEASVERLAAEIGRLLDEPALRRRMADAALGAARVRAADDIAEACVALASGGAR